MILLKMLKDSVDLAQGNIGVARNVDTLWETTVAVPEPAAWMLFASAGLLFLIRRVKS